MSRTIPETFTRAGMNFRLIKATDRACMYKNGETHYEVMLIQRHKRPLLINGKQVADAGDEYLPGDSAWGRLGWTFVRRSDAELKYEEVH